MNDDCGYSLDLEEQKKNIFVTQLNENENDDVNAYPIVKESAGKLLETGVNTLQKTLLLKKEVEVDKVEAELEAKREEFRQRMESCAKKQLELQKRQQAMKDRVEKFDKFIKENEAKRRRAILKYQQEVKIYQQKRREGDILFHEMELLRYKHSKLKNKLDMYKKYETYLLKVIDLLPPDYLEIQDSAIAALMMRHTTLKATNTGLVDGINLMTDDVEDFKLKMTKCIQNNNSRKIQINGQLSKLQSEMEIKTTANKRNEHRFLTEKNQLRDQRTELGAILTAIGNMAEKCWRRTDEPLQNLDLDGKLNIIHNYINNLAQVTKTANLAVAASAKRKQQQMANKN